MSAAVLLAAGRKELVEAAHSAAEMIVLMGVSDPMGI
jgi:hypothetical protein